MNGKIGNSHSVGNLLKGYWSDQVIDIAII